LVAPPSRYWYSLYLGYLHKSIAELLDEVLLMLVWWLRTRSRVLLATGADTWDLWSAADALSVMPQQWLRAASIRAD
jgi:hypothetical protein